MESEIVQEFSVQVPGCERDDHTDGVGRIVERHGIALPKNRAEQARERRDDDVHD